MRILRFAFAPALIICVIALVTRYVGSAPLPEVLLHNQLSEMASKKPQSGDYQIRRQPVNSSTQQESRLTIRPLNMASALPASPGLTVGITWLDMQHTHSLGKQIARNPGANNVEMVWNSIQNFDASGNWDITAVMYVAYRINTSTLSPGFGGGELTLGPPAHGDFGNIDIDDQGGSRVSFAQREDVTWPRTLCFGHMFTPGQANHLEDILYLPGPCVEALWPRIATQHRAGIEDLHHAISQTGPTCADSRLYYWRYENYAWSGPALIDSAFSPGYTIAVDKNSDAVAIFFHDIDEPQSNGANNISYYLSTTTGLGFLNGTELGASNKRMLTSYNDTVGGPQAWKHIDARYDHAGRLHVVWDEQQLANKSANAVIRHWNNERNTIRPVMLGTWPVPSAQNSLNLTSLSLGIGDGTTECTISPAGTNLDYLYLTFTKFGGLTAEEQGDTSAAGYPNGELYATISGDGGESWSSPENLTQTKAPDCNPATPGNECRSEDWATLNPNVSDLDIIYVSDLDAGAAVIGEGTFQPDSVKYLRIVGGTEYAEHLCITATPRFDAFLSENLNCEYNAPPGGVQNSEALTIHNLGAGTLQGNVSVLPGAAWLTVTGTADFTIASGGASLDYPIVMDASALSEGAYTGTIRVTHNDPERPSPTDYLVKFYVIDDFICSQKVIMSTGVE